MKHLASTLAISLMATISIPITAIAQSLPRPLNDCGYLFTTDGYEKVCTFHPTTDHAILVVLPNSIQTGRGSHSADFIYLNVPHPSHDYREGRRSYAQVDCYRRDHWHRFTDAWNSDIIPAESDAAKQMLRFVCEEAGIY